MRARTFVTALIAATGVLAVGDFAAAERNSERHAKAERCLGLTCVHPSSPHAVPQANGDVPSVSGPGRLAQQRNAGFYEYGGGTTLGTRAVAYVVPYRQANRMPEDVRDLPAVDASRANFRLGTVVIFGPDVSLLVPRRGAATAEGERAIAQASATDRYGCNDNHFCLYVCSGFDRGSPSCGMVQFGPVYVGKGWQRLGNYGMNDRSQSMRNRRDRDSLLAQDWVCRNGTCTGSGPRYCADSHSADANLAQNVGNPNMENRASAFANVPDDIHC